MINTIQANTSDELIEKKSKFIANLYYVQSEREVENIIAMTRKKYYDARHNCYAYSITTEEGVINRMSDDGEPSGTAGAPMLNVLQKRGLTNVLIIVTRYFGGILLGTGGLVKAYTGACLKAIEKAKIVQEQRGYVIQLKIPYMDFEKFNYYCNKNQINMVKIDYQESVICQIEVTNKEKQEIIENKEELNFKVEKIEILEQKNIRKNTEI